MEFLFFLSVVLFTTTSHCLFLRNEPFHSKKSPSETITHYEVVYPELTYNSEGSYKEYPETLQVSLYLDGNRYQIDLHLNKILLSPMFCSWYHMEGKKVEHDRHRNCFYQGTVKHHNNWKALISTCYGLRGWFGDISDVNKLYHIEPLEETSLTSQHVVYKDSEHKNDKNGVCGTSHKHHSSSRQETTATPNTSGKNRLRRQASETLIVEWLVVNDYIQYMNYNQNLSAVVHRAIEIANHVDMLYQALNIRVVLSYSLTWTDSQQIQQTTDSDTLIDLFEAYHRTDADLMNIEHDSAMLITGIDIDGSTAGVANVDGMCQYDRSVGFTQDSGSSVNSVGGIAAHELGHIFNMQHDDDSSCNCPDSNSGCIMNAFLGFPPPTQFSQCSKDQLSDGLNRGGGICLDNNPTTLVGDPMCGNGIKEPGEVCDCGSLQDCQDPCCNATTCTLSAGSQCGEGPCCNDECQFVDYGTTCRTSDGECEITEYCSGESAECSQNTYIQNGIPCGNNNSAYCYDGSCVSHTTQCRQYYGQDSQASASACYSQRNIMGVQSGHCGAVNQAFVECAIENVNCGSIHCNGGQIIFSNIQYSSTLTYGTNFALGQRCQWFTTQATADEISPGLVRDGTKCGDGKLCISQECVSLSALGVTSCPIGTNSEVCSGNGVCNNLDQCSCSVGYTGNNCGQDINNTNTNTQDNNTANTAGIAAGVIISLFVLIGVSVAIVVVVVLVTMKKKRGKSTNLSATSGKDKKPPVVIKRIGGHGSKDDLSAKHIQMNEANVYKSSPRYPRPGAPPTNQTSHRPSPSPKSHNQLAAKPPPPSRPTPPPSRTPPRPPMPSSGHHLVPPGPRTQPTGHSSPAATKPQTAPKPSKLTARWPPTT